VSIGYALCVDGAARAQLPPYGVAVSADPEEQHTVAVVTGAARNIGAAIVDRLLQDDGVTVVGIDRDERALREFASNRADRFVPWVADLGEADPRTLAAAVIERHGPVQSFAANAGVSTRSTFLEIAIEDFDHVMAVNVRSHWFLAQTFAKDLIDRGLGGSFVFTSSVHEHCRRGFPHYSASKAAIGMLVREAAAELGAHGIRVNAVAPGFTTEAGDKIDDRALRATPIGRPVRPHEVADVVTMLISPRTAAVTGSTWTVDGGLSTHSWVDD
jgi:NAD(P)-dependent dehydrogenase (short-subunit alcohol dehydrogenase family)